MGKDSPVQEESVSASCSLSSGEFPKHLFVVCLDESHKKHVSFTRLLETDGMPFMSVRIGSQWKFPI